MMSSHAEGDKVWHMRFHFLCLAVERPSLIADSHYAFDGLEWLNITRPTPSRRVLGQWFVPQIHNVTYFVFLALSSLSNVVTICAIHPCECNGFDDIARRNPADVRLVPVQVPSPRLTLLLSPKPQTIGSFMAGLIPPLRGMRAAAIKSSLRVLSLPMVLRRFETACLTSSVFAMDVLPMSMTVFWSYGIPLGELCVCRCLKYLCRSGTITTSTTALQKTSSQASATIPKGYWRSLPSWRCWRCRRSRTIVAFIFLPISERRQRMGHMFGLSDPLEIGGGCIGVQIEWSPFLSNKVRFCLAHAHMGGDLFCLQPR